MTKVRLFFLKYEASFYWVACVNKVLFFLKRKFIFPTGAYHIENNCLKKPLSIYPQKIENLIILRKCIVGNQGLKTKHFNLLIFNDIYFLPYSSSACKSFYNILISSWVSVFLYKIQSSAYNQHDDDIRLGTSLTYNKNPKTVPCGTPLSYSTSTGFE